MTFTRWSFKLPDALFPSDFADRAVKHHGVDRRTETIGGKAVIFLDRSHGDLIRSVWIIDIPVRLPVSSVVRYCRDLDLPVSEFDVVLHDLPA